MKILGVVDSYAKKVGDIIPDWLLSLFARVAVFFVFWKSVQTKIDGVNIAGQNLAFWNVTETTIQLFEYEYNLPFIPPTIAAYMATFGEFFLSLGILFGLLTRLSALGLLLMTIVIQIFVYPNAWGVHILWAAVLLYILKSGGGKIALDSFIK